MNPHFLLCFGFVLVFSACNKESDLEGLDYYLNLNSP